MNFPIEWHVFIIPGFIYGCALYFTLKEERRKELLAFSEKHQIVSLIIITIISYLFGLVANFILIKIMRPFLEILNLGYFHTYSNSSVYNEVMITQFSSENLYYNLRYGHDTLLILRSLSFSLFLLSFSILFFVSFKSGKTKQSKVIYIISSIIFFISIFLLIDYFGNNNFTLLLTTLALIIISIIILIFNTKRNIVLPCLFLFSFFFECYYFKTNIEHKEFRNVSYKYILDQNQYPEHIKK